MAPTSTQWDHQYHIVRRENLFRNPPKDQTAYPALQEAVNPHIESFNALFRDEGVSSRSPNLLQHAIADIGAKTYVDTSDPSDWNQLTVRIKSVNLRPSALPPSNRTSIRREIYPSECRQRQVTYRGRLSAALEFQVNGGETYETVRELGYVPIMLKSNRCYLEGLSPAQLVECMEESEELGGYFVVNGIEKIIRLLQVNRRNFPIAVSRPSFQNRGPGYTPYAIICRSVRPDESSQTNVLHYLNDGNIVLRFSWRKSEYLLPIVMVLKALVDTNDRAIFEALVGPAGSAATKNTYLTDRVEVLLRTYKSYNLYSKAATRIFLGEKFRAVMGISPTLSHYEAGTEFLRKVILVHLGHLSVTEEQDQDKFNYMTFMMRKLYSLSAGECAVDNADAVQNHEILLGGFLYGQILKERLEEYVGANLRLALQDYLVRDPAARFTSKNFVSDFPTKILRKMNENIGNSLEYFLSTGNLSSPTGLDLQQASGFTVVAEKINFLRFLSHFRMVHRGSFFAELKTTTVRKLLPESWGFLCPVHTPDGAPCGLLNHFAHKCKIMTEAVDVSAIPKLVAEMGAVETSTATVEESVAVVLDGRILGWATPAGAKRIADTFRHWKVQGLHGVPLMLEIGYVPIAKEGSYPGVYMASRPARMIRPVKYLPLGKEDWVGPLEQPYMSIAVTPEEVTSGQTHVEFAPTNVLSILANMTPFSDFNQSPRNMYQCQMAKQTMGTPGTSLHHRADNKMYRLQAGQTPVVRSPMHNAYGVDNFPNGTNAVVAVISYTGYDMDDAMIINKSAHERGFAFGTIFKTHTVSLRPTARGRQQRGVTHLFGFPDKTHVKDSVLEIIDDDGFPRVGQQVKEGDPMCAYYGVQKDANGNYVSTTGDIVYDRYKETEPGYIDQVRILGTEHAVSATGEPEPIQTISIKIRIPRSTNIGDKFSSRHGQKGVCSQKWPAIDMPFSESGIQPDVIINPHAFPSRMTIGMFVESLAGKAGTLHGLAQDCTPFQFNEENRAADYFGEQLVKAGYNYHGNEPMYSGITGEELAADIYIGVVYYQRLRHMVNDKFQVRTTGPIVPTTNQPVKGRKRHGGIRVGEMERDALLAHGTAFLLQDRLLNCSDYTRAWICRSCGSFMSVQPAVSPYLQRRRKTNTVRCRRCAVRLEDADASQLDGETWEDGEGTQWVGGDETAQVVVPGVLRYLDVELAAMGVKLKYNVSRDDVPRMGPKRKLKLEDMQLEGLLKQ